jgi:hypothetical protein
MAQYSKYSPAGSGGGGGGGVTSINSQSGPAITIAAGSGVSVNSVGNVVTITNTGSLPNAHTEYHTLLSGEITAKAITLTAIPAVAANTMLDTVGGTSQIYSVDFTVSGSTLSWNGLGLDGLLAAGDILRIQYLS